METRHTHTPYGYSKTGAFVLALFFCMPVLAFAFVTPSSDPLFNASGMVPGAVLNSSVEIENTTERTLTAQIGPSNSSDSDGLGDYLQLEIKEGAASLYTNSLTDFFAGSPVELTDVDSGSSRTYSLILSFDPNTPQNLMGTSVDFDLCVGFKGGQIQCGTNTNPSYSQGSYGGGGGYSQGSYDPGYSQGSYGGGNGQQITLTGVGGDPDSGEDITDDEEESVPGPIPRVLGAETSNYPFGAPNTGLGGIFSTHTALTQMLLLALVLFVVGSLIAVRKLLERKKE